MRKSVDKKKTLNGMTLTGAIEYFSLWIEKVEESVNEKKAHDKDLRTSDTEARNLALAALKDATATTKQAQDKYNDLHNDLQRKGEVDRAQFARKEDIDEKLFRIESDSKDTVRRLESRLDLLDAFRNQLGGTVLKANEDKSQKNWQIGIWVLVILELIRLIMPYIKTS